MPRVRRAVGVDPGEARGDDPLGDDGVTQERAPHDRRVLRASLRIDPRERDPGTEEEVEPLLGETGPVPEPCAQPLECLLRQLSTEIGVRGHAFQVRDHSSRRPGGDGIEADLARRPGEAVPEVGGLHAAFRVNRVDVEVLALTGTSIGQSRGHGLDELLPRFVIGDGAA